MNPTEKIRAELELENLKNKAGLHETETAEHLVYVLKAIWLQEKGNTEGALETLKKLRDNLKAILRP
jgi:hypothetical protein